jgi:hypothetical protein
VYAGEVAPHEVVELARAAVRRLTDAAPTAGEAREVLALIERVGSGPPYTVALAGDPGSRTALLNQLAGEYLFDPARQEASKVVMTLRRGAATTIRARRRDGTLEQIARGEGVVTPDGDAGDDLAVPLAAYPERATTAPPRAVTGAAAAPARVDPAPAPQARPPWWAIWRWLALWLVAWRTRSRRLLPPAGASVAPGEASAGVQAAPAGPMSAMSAVTSRVRSIARTVARATHLGDRRQQLVDALRAWSADEAIERLFVEVEGGPLPDKVVVIELPSRADARSLDAVVADACLVACAEHGFAMTDQLETVLTIVPHLFVVGSALPVGCDPSVRLLGSFQAAAPALGQAAMVERAYTAGQRASALLSSACLTLDRLISDAETGFRARIQRLEALRIASPDDYTATALARIRDAVVEHAHHRILRALGQLDGAIERHGGEWAARLRDAPSADALRTVAAQLDQESAAVLQAAQTVAHRALIGELTEYAHARYHELVSALRRGSSRVDAVPSWLTIDVGFGDPMSGTKLGTVASRLTSLFRSLDALKADAIAQLEQRIAKLRQVAGANLRDAEPRLEPAVTGTLAIALRAEVERHTAWLDGELAREQLAIDAERAQITALALVRDRATRDRRELLVALDRLVTELP